MVKTAQILLLLLVAVAVQSYGGRRYFRGRSHGRFRDPNNYYHNRRRGDAERYREMKHYPNKHHQKNLYNSGDQAAVDSSHILRHPEVPDDRPLTGSHPQHVKDSESISATEQPPLIDPVPDNPSSVDDGNFNGDDSVTKPEVNLPGAVNNDKPDDVANVIDRPKSPNLKEPYHIDDNMNGNKPSSEENPDGTIHVDGLSPTGSNEQPEGDGSINGLPTDDLDTNLDGNVDGNVDDNSGGNIGGNINLDKPTGSTNVNGLEPGENVGSSSFKPPTGDQRPNYDDGYLNNHESLPEYKDKPGHNGNNIDDDAFPPNGDDGNINVNGLSPGADNNEPNDGGNSDDNISGHGFINNDGLSPGGDDGKHNGNTININGLSPGGDDADRHDNNEHGGLPSDVLGDGFIGAHVHLPDITGHIDNGGLLPEPEPEPKANVSGHIDHHFIQPVLNPGIPTHFDINQSHPLFQGHNLPNSGDHVIPSSMPGDYDRPDEIPSIEIPGQVDNKHDGKQNNSFMIPVLLPGGGHIMVPSSELGNIPSYIIVMINGQPTLIQNPAGLGNGSGNAGHSLDLGKLIIGNNGLSIGGIPSGTVLPSWLNLAGIGGNGGASIMQPIWIGSQLPNFGGGGATGGQFIFRNEPVQTVPVPIPVPRPMPPPRPIFPTPQPIPMPGPIVPGFNINTYPGFPWPSIWNPSNPNVNMNFTHMPLTPNPGSNIDWNSLFDLLANIDSRLPRPQPPKPKEPLPTPQPNYYYPYPYPPYPYPPNYPNNNKPTGPSTNVDNGKDTSNGPESPPDVPLEPRPVPQPEPEPEPRPEPRPMPLPEPEPEPQPEPRPMPQPEPEPEPRPEPRPMPQPEPEPEPQPEPRPMPQPEPEPEPKPKPRPEPQPGPGPDIPLESRPNISSVTLEHNKDNSLGTGQDIPVESRPGHPEHHHHEMPIIKLPGIQITLPKPTHIGKPKPGYPGLDSGLIDILNVLLKFPDRNSLTPKNLGPLIKLLLAILKPGDEKQPLIPTLDNDIKGQPDLGNLGHVLLHLLDGQKEPNLSVLVEPGMDEGTRGNLILLLQLLANNLGGGSYPSMGYYQPENPLLYFLGHFPCDHPNIQAISGMQSNSNLWQLLANMYGHNYDQELRLERSAEETDDKPAEATETKEKI